MGPSLSTEVALAALTDEVLDNMDDGVTSGVILLDLLGF